MICKLPGELGVPELYNFVVCAVQPRPIALVSTVDVSGGVNVAPFSFFTVGGVNPVSLAFCPNSKGDGSDKATLQNLEASGEFVINVVERAAATAVGLSGASSGSEKFPETGLSLREPRMLKTPLIAEASVAFECKLFQVIRHGLGSFASIYVIGEVVAIHAESAIWAEPLQLSPIGRLGGPEYIDLAGPEKFVL